jgi:hypothetical protein
VFIDVGSLIAYAFVLVMAFFLVGVTALFGLLHWVMRRRERRTAPPARIAVPTQRTEPEWSAVAARLLPRHTLTRRP